MISTWFEGYLFAIYQVFFGLGIIETIDHQQFLSDRPFWNKASKTKNNTYPFNILQDISVTG